LVGGTVTRLEPSEAKAGARVNALSITATVESLSFEFM
jgi:hypothetical protein